MFRTDVFSGGICNQKMSKRNYTGKDRTSYNSASFDAENAAVLSVFFDLNKEK